MDSSIKATNNLGLELKIIQEENEKLHLDVEELRNTNAYLKNLNDMLVAEIKDYESTQEKLMLQVIGFAIE